MFRANRIYLSLIGLVIAGELALTVAGGPLKPTFVTAVSKFGVEMELRSDTKILADEMLRGHTMLGSETKPPAIPGMHDDDERPLFGPNVQVNDPALDNTQIFPGFRPFLHFTQSETTVAAHDRNIVVSYNNSAGASLTLGPGGNFAFFSRLQLSGYSFSSDGGKTWTSDFVPAAPGVGPFTFGDGVVVVDRRGNFYYASLGQTAAGDGAVVVNKSTDGGQTFSAGVIVGVDDGSDKNWIAVGPDPKHRDRDNVYVTWTSFLPGPPAGPGGSAVAFAVSTDGGQTFQSRIIFAPGTDPDPTHPQNFIQFTNPVVDQSNGRLYIPFGRFSNADTDFIQMLVSDDAGQTFNFVNFNLPGTPDPTLVPLVQPGTFEDCGNPGGGFRLAIVQGSDIGGGRFGTSRFIQSTRLVLQPSIAAADGHVFLAFHSSDSPFFGDPGSGSNIFLIASHNSGKTWSKPRQVNPDVANDFRHIHPAIALEEDEQQVSISYYTQHTGGSVDLDLVNAELDGKKVNVSDLIRITSQSFNLPPTNIPIPTAALPFRTQNYDRNIVSCYALGEYNGLFNNQGKLYAVWGDGRNRVTEPVNALDPLSGLTHPQEDTFFQKVRRKD
jgi:hypothetical protein